MKRFIVASSIAIALGLCGAVAFGQSSSLPALPPASASAPSAASTTAAPPSNVSGLEHAARGVVVLERAGKAVALGAVLAGDGRILTALSPLADGNSLDARYADGSVVAVRVGHFDRVWDLALLVPQVGRWQQGLAASDEDPLRAGAQLQSFTQRRQKAVLASVSIKGRAQLLGGDGELLHEALEISSRVAPADLGAPVVDAQGKVNAIVSRACAPTHQPSSACRPVPYGVPVHAIRKFLRLAPAHATAPNAWLGIQGLAADTSVVRGVRVASVHPNSPASEAGLGAGQDATVADVIVAVDGTPVLSPEQLAGLVRQRAGGETASLIILREGKYKHLPVSLRAAPATRPQPAPTAP